MSSWRRAGGLVKWCSSKKQKMVSLSSHFSYASKRPVSSTPLFVISWYSWLRVQRGGPGTTKTCITRNSKFRSWSLCNSGLQKTRVTTRASCVNLRELDEAVHSNQEVSIPQSLTGSVLRCIWRRSLTLSWCNSPRTPVRGPRLAAHVSPTVAIAL